VNIGELNGQSVIGLNEVKRGCEVGCETVEVQIVPDVPDVSASFVTSPNHVFALSNVRRPTRDGDPVDRTRFPIRTDYFSDELWSPPGAWNVIRKRERGLIVFTLEERSPTVHKRENLCIRA
jgi:hypothetical protein